jgi:outer membrane protein assembly factor BamD
MRPPRRLLAALGFALGLSACENLELNGGPRHASLTYTDDAKSAYDEALVSFRDKDWESARALFAEVKKLFAYSRYARLAELRLADIDFEQEKYSEAISAYREFATAHKNDPDLEYARYRMVKALALDIDDTPFLPPHEERDQATSQEAYKEVRSFLREFPKTRYKADVDYILQVALSRVARHELYVARYYLRRDNFDAAIARIDYAQKAYPQSNMIPEALVLKAETLMKMKRWDDARATLKLAMEHTESPFSRAASNYLAELNARGGGSPADASRPPQGEGSPRTPNAPGFPPAANPTPSPAAPSATAPTPGVP